MMRPWLRWMPAVAVPAVIAATVLIAPLQAGAEPTLPSKTPAEVLAMLAKHDARALSGTLEQSADLGLPQLPSGTPTPGPDGLSTVLELLTSPHTARIYTDGASNARIQVMDRLAERDVVATKTDVWFYSSRENTATHVALPAHATTKDYATPRPGMPTPEALAERFLAAADPSTTVALEADTRVAGRAAYHLVFTPKTDATTLESAAVYVDGETGLPLGVEVRARGQQDPAFRLAFTQLSLGAPDPSLFTFTPPAGATVKELPLNGLPLTGMLPIPMPGGVAKPTLPVPPQPAPDATPPQPSDHPSLPTNHQQTRPHVTGTGWDAVVELPGSGLQAALDKTPLLAQLARPVSGGRLFSTSLVNILLTDDGRVFVGLVPPERLQSVAAAG